MPQPDALKAALTDFRAAQAHLQKVMLEAPRDEAGRQQFEAALEAAVLAGERMSAIFAKMKH